MKKTLIFALAMKIGRQEYEDICVAIVKATGREIKTPRDFDFLVMRIYDCTRMQLSVSTLKRFFGYVDKENAGKGELRLSTLNILANYVGYTGWEAFCKREETEENADGSDLFYANRILETSSLNVGNLIQLIWNPNRCVTVRYSGNNVFVVTESINSKLSVGDTFTCTLFVENLPLTLINLIHEGGSPCCYVCGKSGGITFHYPYNPIATKSQP